MQTRVQIPAYLDHWMRGDRYGVVQGKAKRRIPTKHGVSDILIVKLDKSGLVLRLVADDCQEIA